MKDKIARSLADEVYGEHLKLRDRVNINTNSIAEFKSKYVECENCGCLVRKEKAIKVQEMVDKTASFSFAYLGHEPYKLIIPDEKEIKTTYYCLHCNPNIKTNETKKCKKQRK